MFQPVASRRIRATCDLLALTAAAFCCAGVALTIDIAFYPLLLWSSLVCGSVSGIVIGICQTKRSRVISLVLAIAMALLQFACHAKLAWSGLYLSMCGSLATYSVPAITLILSSCAGLVLAGDSTHATLLSRRHRVIRLFCGPLFTGLTLALTVSLLEFYRSNPIVSPASLMMMLHSCWYASIALVMGIVFLRLTPNFGQQPESLIQEWEVRFLVIAVICKITATASFAVQRPDALWAMPLSMVILAIAAAALIVQKDWNPSSGQQAAAAAG